MNIVFAGAATAAGFVFSLVCLDVARLAAGRRWPVQMAGLQIETRFFPWFLACVAGPALIWEASWRVRPDSVIAIADRVLCFTLTAVWSLCYGIVLWSILASTGALPPVG